MISTRTMLAVGLTGFTLFGCNGSSNDDPQVVCTPSIEPGLQITILDADTKESTSCGATVVVQDGNFEETVSNEAGPDCQNSKKLTAAEERAGTYHLIVTKEGYQEANVYDVIVESGTCHVQTKDITVELLK